MTSRRSHYFCAALSFDLCLMLHLSSLMPAKVVSLQSLNTNCNPELLPSCFNRLIEVMAPQRLLLAKQQASEGCMHTVREGLTGHNGVILGLYRANGKNASYYNIIGYILELYRDNGKENGSYCLGLPFSGSPQPLRSYGEILHVVVGVLVSYTGYIPSSGIL